MKMAKTFVYRSTLQRLQSSFIAVLSMLVFAGLMLVCSTKMAKATTTSGSVAMKPAAKSQNQRSKRAPKRPVKTTSIKSIQFDASGMRLSEDQKAHLSYILDRNKAIDLNTAKRIVLATYRYAEQHSFDPVFVLAMVRHESRFNPMAVSNHGAVGLMQVMPKYHRARFNGHSPTQIEASIRVGVEVLADCRGRTGRAPNAELALLNCYSGGGGKKYLADHNRFRREIQYGQISTLFAMKT